MRQHTRHLSPAMCEPCCHLAQIYWQITGWTLLYIFSVFCPDLLIVEMGMRSEDVQGRPAQSLGSARPHSCTLYYRVLTSLSPAIFIFIICWGVRSEERHSTHSTDSNHSRADTLHQTAELLRMRTQTTAPETFTTWKIFANCPASSARRVSTFIVSCNGYCLTHSSLLGRLQDRQSQ